LDDVLLDECVARGLRPSCGQESWAKAVKVKEILERHHYDDVQIVEGRCPEMGISVIVRKFIYGNDREYGTNGFKPTWIENANAGDGLSCAHDVMEHGLREPNAGVGELMAMGACIYTRGVPGWFECERPNAYYKPPEQIASTIAR
jgi:hypothetical protein